MNGPRFSVNSTGARQIVTRTCLREEYGSPFFITRPLLWNLLCGLCRIGHLHIPSLVAPLVTLLAPLVTLLAPLLPTLLPTLLLTLLLFLFLFLFLLRQENKCR